jgi:hypothetical protein
VLDGLQIHVRAERLDHTRAGVFFQEILTGRVNTKRVEMEPDTDQIALPFASWKAVWTLYISEQRGSGLPTVSASHFKRVRRKGKCVRPPSFAVICAYSKCDD